MAAKPFQILSLDGGGIKGIFSAAVLAHIEEDLKIDITDHFDLETFVHKTINQKEEILWHVE